MEEADLRREGWIQAACGSLQPGQIVTLPVLSGSMGAQMPPGGTIRVLACSWREIWSGDILVFREGFRLVAHRLLLRWSVGASAVIYQKGDANPLGGFLAGRQIVGVVTESHDPEGRVVYSRASTRTQARAAARQQMVRVFWYPFRRMIRFFWRLDGRQPCDTAR
jgi:hypothetical protein